MELQTAENKIIKMLEKQNENQAIEEIKDLFQNIHFDGTENSIQKRSKKEKIEEDLDYILQKYNLNQIAINVFRILEKTFFSKNI